MSGRTRTDFARWLLDRFEDELGEGMTVDANSARLAARNLAVALVDAGWATSPERPPGDPQVTRPTALADYLLARILAEYPEGTRLDAGAVVDGSENVASALVEQGWVTAS